MHNSHSFARLQLEATGWTVSNRFYLFISKSCDLLSWFMHSVHRPRCFIEDLDPDEELWPSSQHGTLLLFFEPIKKCMSGGWWCKIKKNTAHLEFHHLCLSPRDWISWINLHFPVWFALVLHQNDWDADGADQTCQQWGLLLSLLQCSPWLAGGARMPNTCCPCSNIF